LGGNGKRIKTKTAILFITGKYSRKVLPFHLPFSGFGNKQLNNKKKIMKQFIGIICIIIGVVSFFKCMATWSGSIPELIGYIIGLGLIAGVPAYFCLRKPKNKEQKGIK
jgi:hypothetical protein